MAAVSDILAGAFRRAGLLAYGEDLSAADSQAGLELLNDMMAGMKADGIDVQWTTVVAATEQFQLADEHIEGVKALLARDIANDNGATPSNAVNIKARIGRDRLAADYRIYDDMQSETGLLTLPSQRKTRFAIR